jgi:serine/threonine protein kinase
MYMLQVKQEWEVHASLQHPNIISAFLGMEDSAGVRLFMEYAGDSDAYSYINAKQRLSLREDDARQLVYDVLTALHHMHRQVGRTQQLDGGYTLLSACD